MSVTLTGRDEVSRFLQRLPGELTKVLRGAGRVGGKVIADEARLGTRSDDVRNGIVVKERLDGDQVRVTVTIKPGWARSLAIWEEYGTAPHFISVDDSQRMGMSVGRVNSKVKDGSLVIGGQFVGKTVLHPGVDPHPFLRTALDRQRGEAVAAAASYVAARVTRGGIDVPSELGDDE